MLVFAPAVGEFMVPALLVGPEGGLTPDEVRAAGEHGFLPTHLGPRTLRTETAGAAVSALLAFWAGRFDADPGSA